MLHFIFEPLHKKIRETVKRLCLQKGFEVWVEDRDPARVAAEFVDHR